MMRLSTLTAVLFGLVLSIGAVAARDIHVAAPGTVPPGGDGSAERPFATWQDAIEAGAGAGDRLLLAAGNHGMLQMRRYGDLGGLVIEPAPGAEAHVDRIAIDRSGNVRIGGLQVWPSELPVGRAPIVSVAGNAPNVHLYDLDIRTSEDATDYLNWNVDTWQARKVIGASLDGPGTRLTGSRLTGIRHGIVARGPDIQISGNLVEGFSGDGLRGIGDNNVFTGNAVRNCIKIDENHDDGFQSWSRPDPEDPRNADKREAVRNLRIESNMIQEWVGPPDHPLRCVLQGIVMFDGPYENVVIRNNFVSISAFHGVTVAMGLGGEISHNTVVNARELANPKKPWVGVFSSKQGKPSRDMVIANNIAHNFKLDGRGSGSVAVQNLKAPRQTTIYRDPARGDWRIKPDHGAASAADPGFVPPRDILGTDRPLGAGADLGAFETDGTAPK